MRIKGRKFNFLIQNKRLPNGRVTRLEFIEHPGAALIVPYQDERHIIFLSQYRAVLGKRILELPAGTVDPRESPFVCAQRELIEETGFSACRWGKLGSIYPVPGYSTEVIHIFSAKKLQRTPGIQDDDEIIKIHILNRLQVRKLFRQKKIVDAKTICGLILCGWL